MLALGNLKGGNQLQNLHLRLVFERGLANAVVRVEVLLVEFEWHSLFG